MKKDLKDYLHLYLGCECQLFWVHENGSLEYERNGTLVSIREETPEQYGLGFKCKAGVREGNFVYYNYPYAGVKPILRNLSDMTKEEKMQMQDLVGWLDYMHYINSGFYNSEMLLFLLSKHFDLFGLIKDGLAIDINSI